MPAPMLLTTGEHSRALFGMNSKRFLERDGELANVGGNFARLLGQSD